MGLGARSNRGGNLLQRGYCGVTCCKTVDYGAVRVRAIARARRLKSPPPCWPRTSSGASGMRVTLLRAANSGLLAITSSGRWANRNKILSGRSRNTSRQASWLSPFMYFSGSIGREATERRSDEERFGCVRLGILGHIGDSHLYDNITTLSVAGACAGFPYCGSNCRDSDFDCSPDDGNLCPGSIPCPCTKRGRRGRNRRAVRLSLSWALGVP